MLYAVTRTTECNAVGASLVYRGATLHATLLTHPLVTQTSHTHDRMWKQWRWQKARAMSQCIKAVRAYLSLALCVTLGSSAEEHC